jgi:phosphoglycolate phosphatase-like HAD superfamily hydrolase
VRHVVWDWNGTLFDDLPAVVASVNASLDMLGAGPIDEDGYRAVYRRPVHLAYEALLGRPVGVEEMARIDRTFHDAYQEMARDVPLAGDAGDAVRCVAAGGATQSVLSMWWHDRLLPTVRRLGLYEDMVLVEGHRGQPGEAKSAHLSAHIGRLAGLLPGLEEGDVVVIGDITDDAAAAAAVGARCVLFDGGSQTVEDLAATGFPVAFTLVEAVELALGPC